MKILVCIFICLHSFTATASGVVDMIPFLQEKREGFSAIYDGWSAIRSLIYRPSIMEIEQMFQIAVSDKFGDFTNRSIMFSEAKLQYVLFDGDLFGIVMEAKVKILPSKTTRCYIYSRLNEKDMLWYLNDYKCEVEKLESF